MVLQEFIKWNGGYLRCMCIGQEDIRVMTGHAVSQALMLENSSGGHHELPTTQPTV